MFKKRATARVAVIGLGDFGQNVAFALVEHACRVLGIDRDAGRVWRLHDRLHCVVLDATDEQALREIDILAFDAVVVAIEDDLESSMLTTLTLKNLGVPHVVCISATNHMRRALLNVGADRVLEPQSETAARLAFELQHCNLKELLTLTAASCLATLETPAALVHKPISALIPNDVSQQLTVLAIQRGERSLVSPAPDTILLADDVLVILGSEAAMAGLHPYM